MDALQASQIVKRVIGEVAGTIATNGIQELDRTERGGVSTFGYVRNCLIATAYNAVRALPGFNASYGEFFRAVEGEVNAALRSETSSSAYTVHDEVARLHDEEGMDWSDALAFCNID